MTEIEQPTANILRIPWAFCRHVALLDRRVHLKASAHGPTTKSNVTHISLRQPGDRLARRTCSLSGPGCGGDEALRQIAETCLDAYQAQGFLEAPHAATIDLPPIAEGPGTTIGRYKLLEEIAEGGMGVVYMAEQREPVRRKVALKIIKPGMDTREVIARFEAERQALAMMDHPNIAKVFDAGETESGRPYFVMELVHGIPLTDYCDQNELDDSASGWSCSSRSARPCITPIRRGSSIATSSPPT